MKYVRKHINEDFIDSYDNDVEDNSINDIAKETYHKYVLKKIISIIDSHIDEIEHGSFTSKYSKTPITYETLLWDPNSASYMFIPSTAALYCTEYLDLIKSLCTKRLNNEQVEVTVMRTFGIHNNIIPMIRVIGNSSNDFYFRRRYLHYLWNTDFFMTDHVDMMINEEGNEEEIKKICDIVSNDPYLKDFNNLLSIIICICRLHSDSLTKETQRFIKKYAGTEYKELMRKKFIWKDGYESLLDKELSVYENIESFADKTLRQNHINEEKNY